MTIDKKNYRMRIVLEGSRRYDTIEEFDFVFDSLLDVVTVFESLKLITNKIPQPEEYNLLDRVKTDLCELHEEEIEVFKRWWVDEMEQDL